MWPRGVEFCIVDFETTGLFPQHSDRVVEYAFVVVRDGHIIDQHSALINPTRPMSEGASRANGITDDMLAGQPRFDKAGSRLWHAVNDRVLVAHNARFDLNCLAHECKKVGWAQPQFRAVDSLKLARSLWSGQVNNKLETLAALCGHRWSGDAHRAMADVEALFTVMDRLCRQFPENLGTLGGLLRTGEVQPTIVQSVEQVALSGTAKLLNRNRGTPIQIQYESKASGLSRRTVTPVEIFVDNGMEFLTAYCHRRLENRTFRVSRIKVFN